MRLPAWRATLKKVDVLKGCSDMKGTLFYCVLPWQKYWAHQVWEPVFFSFKL